MNRVTISMAFAAVSALSIGISLPNAAHAQFWGFDSGAPSGSGVSDVYSVSFSNKYRPGEIVVSFGDRRLYHVVGQGRAVSYPIAVPREQSRWSGTLRVSQKRVNPTWTPTPSMRRENPKLPGVVQGGDPQNPLGVRALYLGSTLYRIHGTDAPWTIGQNVSKGCIRMHNSHVIELYDRVRLGAKVTATWNRYSTGAISSSGSGGGSSRGSTDNFLKSVLGDNT